MRWSLLIVLAACSSQQTAHPAEPIRSSSPIIHPIENITRSCRDAALGLEAATRSVRDPENSVAEALTRHCNEDTWPVAAVDCFATMHEGDLGSCSHSLPEAARNRLFAVLSGGGSERMGIAIAHARLSQLQVGVPACDQFIDAVTGVLACEQLPVDVRVELGQQTADLWSLPTSGLAADDMQRMTTVCGDSLTSLLQQASDAGCKQ